MTVHLIGREMLLWSDLDGTHGPAPAGGPTLRPLLAAVSGRTLVAGPHAPDLIDAIPALQVTVLVRGVADAEALSARYADRPGVSICCGSLEKLAAVPAYDTILALDGLDRLCSAEAVELTWDETLSQLLALLRPAGRLLLSVENMFGLHRLVALPPDPSDADWVIADDYDPSRPPTLARLRDRLDRAGLPVVRDYATYPAADSPTVLLGAEAAADPALRGFLEAALGGAFRPGDDRPPALADPVRLATGALRHDLAAELAPAWIVLAAAGGVEPARGGAGDSAGVGASGPAAGSAGGDAVGPTAVVGTETLARDASGRWVRGAGTAVPVGRTLEDLLLAACRRRALPALRELLGGWQTSGAAGVPADQVVVDDGGVFHGLGAAGDPVRALRGFAATVIDGGFADLWPSPADASELTALLAGMTGRELDPRTVPDGPPAGGTTVRELAMARDRLARELAEARAQHEFLERTIAGRDAELKRVRRMNALLAATTPGKAASTLVGGLRAGKRAMRAVVKRTRG